MNFLSIDQPFASSIVMGVCRAVAVPYSTPLRGLTFIHARGLDRMVAQDRQASALLHGGIGQRGLLLEQHQWCILGVAHLVASGDIEHCQLPLVPLPGCRHTLIFDGDVRIFETPVPWSHRGDRLMPAREAMTGANTITIISTPLLSPKVLIARAEQAAAAQALMDDARKD